MNDDIYSLGFDKSLNRDIQNTSSSVVYNSIDDGVNTGQIPSGGNLNLKTLNIGGLVRQVAPGDDIQAAIDAVSREGGGTVQFLAKTYSLSNILTCKDGVSLKGAGRDLTILDFFNGSFGIDCKGSSSSILQNWSISDMTIQNSGASAGLDIDFADYWTLQNIRVSSCANGGIKIDHSQDFFIQNIRSDSNGSYGLFLTSSNVTGKRNTTNFSINLCLTDSNTTHGMFIQHDSSGSTSVRRFFIFGCISNSNGGAGFYFEPTGSSGTNWRGRLASCNSFSNTGIGFDVNSSLMSDLVFVACKSDNNGDDGFEVDSKDILLVGCDSESNSGLDYDINHQEVVLSGCKSTDGVDLSSTEIDINEASAFGTLRGTNITNRELTWCKNNSGQTLRGGNVVILDSTTTGEDITTTTTNGDNKVLGVVQGGGAAGSVFPVVTRGKVITLYANNGTSSISVGDWLSTYSHAYYAKKAVAGDTVFAMALSTPTTSTASISALLVSPRLI